MTKIIDKFKEKIIDKNERINLVINLAYCIYNLFLGIVNVSLLFFTMFFYYLTLGFAKLFALITKKKHPFIEKKQYKTMKIIGISFIPLLTS